MAVNFLAQIWGMALLCMNNDVHMWLLFILYSLKLPFPSKTFPGQVFNYVCLGWRKSLSAEQLLPLILLCLEGNRSAGWLQGGSRDLLRVPHPQCHVPSQRSHLRDIHLLASNVSKVGTGPQLQDRLLQMWGRLGMEYQAQTAPRASSASIGAGGETWQLADVTVPHLTHIQALKWAHRAQHRSQNLSMQIGV